MTPEPNVLDALRLRRPEWQAWLAVVERALEAGDGGAWDAMVPDVGARAPSAPLLADASIAADPQTLGRLLQELTARAARAGAPAMMTLQERLDSVNVPALVVASLTQRRDRVERLAAEAGVDPDALDAVAGLLSVPFLQACRRRWRASIPEGWVEPHCPICGAWPAFAEVRGIERSRFARCRRCGSEWHALPLKCPYCAMDDHEQLVTLVPEQTGATAAIEACRSCFGYVKVLTRLQGCPPAEVIVEDLATVELDLAAVAEGYSRPPGGGYAMEVIVC